MLVVGLEGAMRTSIVFFLIALAAGCAAPDSRTEQAPAALASEPSTAISVTICGEVQHPQAYSFPASTRLADALNQAGGFSEFAARKAVHVRHKDGTLWKYNLRQPGKRGYGGDIVLRDGDVVMVPRLLS